MYASASTCLQRIGQTPALGRLQPAAHADAGVGDHDVRWGVQAAPGGLAQLRVVVQRHDAQRRGDDHPCAPPLQQRGELVASSVGGDPDGEPRRVLS